MTKLYISFVAQSADDAVHIDGRDPVNEAHSFKATIYRPGAADYEVRITDRNGRPLEALAYLSADGRFDRATFGMAFVWIDTVTAAYMIHDMIRNQ